MKKIISLLLSLTMLLSIVSVVDFSAYADTLTTGKCGKNVTYSFDAETGVLTISGEGDMENYNYENNPFYKKSNIKTVIIKNGVTSIGDWVFYNCSSLTSITIPNSVTSIGNWVFRDCTSLTSVAIPTSVTSIGDGVFYCCESLTSIEVSNNNENYSSTDGVLFNKNKSELITYPAGKTDSEYAIPNSVTSIGSYAFFDCESLTSVTIPNSVTSIGSYAFYDCTNLANVYYSGSQSDWNKITIGDYNECLTNAALHCSSTPTPTPEPTPTPNPAPQPPTQPTQESTQQAAQQTAQQQSTQNDTTTAQIEVAKPKSVSPKKVKAAKKAISVEWKKVSGVKGYQVQVATDKKFKKNKKTVTIKKQKTTKTTVKKLKAKKKYYVRVRTYKIVNGKKVYSSWSKIKTVKTK